jgi:hypothetical protein
MQEITRLRTHKWENKLKGACWFSSPSPNPATFSMIYGGCQRISSQNRPATEREERLRERKLRSPFSLLADRGMAVEANSMTVTKNIDLLLLFLWARNYRRINLFMIYSNCTRTCTLISAFLC